ncbi:MAG: hypothetical protein WD716_12065 [Fimbriimonadaceae bacterium]
MEKRKRETVEARSEEAQAFLDLARKIVRVPKEEVERAEKERKEKIGEKNGKKQR